MLLAKKKLLGPFDEMIACNNVTAAAMGRRGKFREQKASFLAYSLFNSAPHKKRSRLFLIEFYPKETGKSKMRGG